MNVKKLYKHDSIHEIYQDATYISDQANKDYTNLKEIVLSFKLKLHDHDGKNGNLTFCQLKIPKEAIQMLAESKGLVPNTYKEAFDLIRQKEKEMEELQLKFEQQLKQKSDLLLDRET